MLKEKLIIKNFGPIKHIELELGKINVLIGDQGTGKSTVAKLLIAIQRTIVRDAFDLPSNNPQNSHTQVFFGYLKLADIKNYLSTDTNISYTSDIYSFEFKENEVISASTSKPKSNMNVINPVSYGLNYIPSERSLSITLSNSLYALIQTGTALPQLFLRFGDKFQKARLEKEIFHYNHIIGVDFKHRDGRDIVVLPDGLQIPIHESSSGIQGAITLLVVFDYIMETSATGNLLVIEEPELNCFPETQNKIIKYIIEKNKIDGKIDTPQYKNEILITTHSPYILTSLNNMMYAYKIGEQKAVETGKVIEKKFWLNPDDVSAYMMLTDGTCKDIFDREEGLIEAEKIDEVSSLLSNQFDKLLDIEYAEK